MNFTLTRKIYTDKSTIGDLTVDDDNNEMIYSGYTMEPPSRKPENYENNNTAIPAGRYLLSIYASPDHGGANVILLNGTPDKFGDIEMHVGNWASAIPGSGAHIDTLGCQLQGLSYIIMNDKDDMIQESEAAFKELSGLTFDRIRQGEVYVDVIDTFTAV